MRHGQPDSCWSPTDFPAPVDRAVPIEPEDASPTGEAGHGRSSGWPRRTRTFRGAYTDDETGQTIIAAGMGEPHLEVLIDRMKRESSGRGATSRKPQGRLIARVAMWCAPESGEGRVHPQEAVAGGAGQRGTTGRSSAWLAARAGAPAKEFVELQHHGRRIPFRGSTASQLSTTASRTRCSSGVLAGYPGRGRGSVTPDRRRLSP